MFVVHPDTKLLQEVTFQVTSHEDSVIVSCATSTELGLIDTHRNLDVVPEEGSLIYSISDMPKKQKNKNCQAENVNMQPVKPQIDVQVKKHIPLHKENKLLCYDKNCQEIKRPRKPRSVMQSVTKEENTDMWLPQPARLCSDKNCQSTRCYKNTCTRRPMYDKNCQL